MSTNVQFSVSADDVKAFGRCWLGVLSRLLVIVIIVVMALHKIAPQRLALGEAL